MTKNETSSTKKFGTIVKNFGWDFVILFVLIINLLLLCWDWIFSIPMINFFISGKFPNLYQSYSPIHDNILTTDLVFVIIYIIDLIIGWSISVFKHKELFYKYPIQHWYDVIGCIPAGSLIIFRLLRVVSIIIRLYKKNLINIHKYRFFKKCIKFYNIIMEEISDRVLLNILAGIKNNIKIGTPITNDIIQKIVLPNKDLIINLVFDKFQQILKTEYDANKNDIAKYVIQKSCDAVESNKELNKLSMIPVVGSQIKVTLERSVSNTVISIIDGLINDVLSNEGQQKLRQTANSITNTALTGIEDDLSKTITNVITETVDLIARTANVKQWKLAEINEKLLTARSSEQPSPDLIEKLEQEYQEMVLKEIQKSWH